ncbi:hypothetical protein PoB_004069900 [Plakobranchus ocellatus]|uniref:Uncharacterized protein n=1 Tax=Plakobranchus ocellatus TaxID=259542 RepID=A0AAV4B2D0_9GAST|nr:hypothetical protein PoB_004069900 [Plakobranchus ocellatus]
MGQRRQDRRDSEIEEKRDKMGRKDGTEKEEGRDKRERRDGKREGEETGQKREKNRTREPVETEQERQERRHKNREKRGKRDGTGPSATNNLNLQKEIMNTTIPLEDLAADRSTLRYILTEQLKSVERKLMCATEHRQVCMVEQQMLRDQKLHKDVRPVAEIDPPVLVSQATNAAALV